MPDQWPVTVRDQLATLLTTDVPVGSGQAAVNLYKSRPQDTFLADTATPAIFLTYSGMDLPRRTTGKDTRIVSLDIVCVANRWRGQQEGEDDLANLVYLVLNSLSKRKNDATYWPLDATWTPAEFGVLWPEEDYATFSARIVWTAQASVAKPS